MNIINCDLSKLEMISSPFPHLSCDNFLDNDYAIKLQTEILNMPKYALVTINRFKYDLMSGKKLKILQ